MALIYLDTCCLNRPSDDQRQPRIRLEAEAVLALIASVRRGTGVEWLGTAVVRTEAERTPDPERRARSLALLEAATRWAFVEPGDVARAISLTGVTGFSTFDALHVAVAERGGADVLLTTDDGLVRRAARHPGALHVPVENPIVWIGRTFPEYGDDR